MNLVEKAELESQVIEALKTCYDPEIPVNIFELGLVYSIDVGSEGEVEIKMTLTTPHCPVATSLPGEVQSKLAAIPNVKNAAVAVVWDPPWDPGKMSEAAKLQLGML
jgi:FeS assembly SUF system protein